LSIEQHRTDQVYEVIRALIENGTREFRPGHIADALREAGSPMLSWEIRGELSRLEAAGLIKSDPKTGAYALADAARKVG
jgi:DNA-binding GntR family transcriptional regulator